MNTVQKIELLSKIQMELRMIQENGHWEQLQGAKISVINLIMELEKNNPDNSGVDWDIPEKKKAIVNTKSMPYDGSLAKARKKAP